MNTDRQSVSRSLVGSTPPTLLPPTRSVTKDAEDRHQAHARSGVMMGTRMRLRRPPKTKDQVYFVEAPRRWVKRGSYRNVSGAGDFGDDR
jgi:hypothetical protein